MAQPRTYCPIVSRQENADGKSMSERPEQKAATLPFYCTL